MPLQFDCTHQSSTFIDRKHLTYFSMHTPIVRVSASGMYHKPVRGHLRHWVLTAKRGDRYAGVRVALLWTTSPCLHLRVNLDRGVAS